MTAPDSDPMPTRLVLASSSPRRRWLMEAAGYEFSIDPAGIDEPEPDGPIPVGEYVADLAYHKARTVARRYGPESLVLAADTSVAVDDSILNKPVDRADAERMLRLQAGRDVEIATGLCLYRPGLCEWVGAVEVTVCRMKPMDDAAIEAILDSGSWKGKAGGYGVQDGDPIISVVRGSWSNVVGLPMERLALLLERYSLFPPGRAEVPIGPGFDPDGHRLRSS